MSGKRRRSGWGRSAGTWRAPGGSSCSSAGAAALLWGLPVFCWPLTVPSNANVCPGPCLGGIGGGQALRWFITVYDHGSRRRQPRRSSWPSRRFTTDQAAGGPAGSAAVRTHRRPTAKESSWASVPGDRAGPDGPPQAAEDAATALGMNQVATNSRCSNCLPPGSPRDGPRCWGVLVSGRLGRRSPGCWQV